MKTIITLLFTTFVSMSFCMQDSQYKPKDTYTLARVSTVQNRLKFWMYVSPMQGRQRCSGLHGVLVFKLKKEGLHDIILGKADIYFGAKQPASGIETYGTSIHLDYNARAENRYVLTHRWIEVAIDKVPEYIDYIGIWHKHCSRNENLIEVNGDCYTLHIEPLSIDKIVPSPDHDKNGTYIIFDECAKLNDRFAAIQKTCDRKNFMKIECSAKDRRHTLKSTAQGNAPVEPSSIAAPLNIPTTNSDSGVALPSMPSPSAFMPLGNTQEFAFDQGMPFNFNEFLCQKDALCRLQAQLDARRLHYVMHSHFKTDIYTVLALQLYNDKKKEIAVQKLKNFAEISSQNYFEQAIVKDKNALVRLALAQFLAHKCKATVRLHIIDEAQDVATSYEMDSANPAISLTVGKYSIASQDHYVPTYRIDSTENPEPIVIT